MAYQEDAIQSLSRFVPVLQALAHQYGMQLYLETYDVIHYVLNWSSENYTFYFCTEVSSLNPPAFHIYIQSAFKYKRKRFPVSYKSLAEIGDDFPPEGLADILEEAREWAAHPEAWDMPGYPPIPGEGPVEPPG